MTVTQLKRHHSGHQMAESSNGELFIYVYQPSHFTKDLVATKISLSTAVGGGFDFQIYDLTLVSSEAVLDKYIVNGLTVQNIVLRYYDIAAIYRAYDKTIDTPSTDDNTIDHIAYNVGQLWTATTVDNAPVYAMDYQETIKVESKHVGFIRYLDSKVFLMATDATDSHYIAFTTDRQMDDVLEAEVSYSYTAYSKYTTTNEILDPTPSGTRVTDSGENITRLLKKEEVLEVNNWFNFDDYKYNRIQDIDTFIKNETEEFTDETKEALKDKKWVLRFLETDYGYFSGTGGNTDVVGMSYNYTINNWTKVTQVSILRLKFKYEGKIYDMGVVDNIQTGGDDPGNEEWDKPEGCECIPFISVKCNYDDKCECFGLGCQKWRIVAGAIGVIILFSLLYIITFPIRLLFRGANSLAKSERKRRNNNKKE